MTQPAAAGLPATGGQAGAGAPSADGLLGPDWVVGPDGLHFRRAARVILLDDRDRVLLLRGHDVDQPSRSWWFTIGGGIDAGEDARAAAAREVFEETGLVLDPAELVGPVIRRSAVFDFLRMRCRQDEEIFLARVGGSWAADGDGLSTEGWTAIELDVIDELRWWDLDELDRVEIEVFPVGLADLVRGLVGGWDGTVRDLGEDLD